MQSHSVLDTSQAATSSSRTWAVVGVVGLAWIALQSSGLMGAADDLTGVMAAVVAMVSTAIGLRRYRPRPAWPWLATIAALTLFLISVVLRAGYGTVGDLSAARSYLPDVVALSGYAVLTIAVAGLAGARRGHSDDTDAVIDGVIAALAVMALAWVYLVTPALAKQQVSFGIEVLMVAYPVLSLFVFALGCRLIFSRGRRPAPARWFILIAIFFLLVGDVLFMLVDSTLVDIPMRFADIPYALAYLSYSMAVLHPSMGRVVQQRTSDEITVSRDRLVAVCVALLVPAFIFVTGFDTTDPADRAALGGIVVVLVSVAVWRVYRALRQHASSQARLAHQASHDSLTHLPNRAYLAEHLGRAFATSAEVGGSVTLLHIDIDRFKLVNDTMGHSVGDELLIAVGARLNERVRPQDLVTHIGGDEFAILVTGLAAEERAIDFAERSRLMLKDPFDIGGSEIGVTASVGVAYQAAANGSPESLARDADTAVNHAKSAGGDDVAIFDSSMRERVAERLHLERELRHALGRGELHLEYQPKLRLSDSRVVGFEALLRWNHPELGAVRPDKFIPIAEDTGMIVEIGAFVIESACAQLARLDSVLPAGSQLSISVNVSARQLRSDSFVGVITESLVRNGIRPESLCLELTESILMENLDVVSAQLRMIRDFGTRISIDDFGTGYSSLAYLSKLPVDEIKIDRTFIKALGEDPSAESLVKAVVFIASSLGIVTVAEGVETEEQASKVRAAGVNEVQGFLYSRPIADDDMISTLARLGAAVRPGLRAVPPLPRALGTIA